MSNGGISRLPHQSVESPETNSCQWFSKFSDADVVKARVISCGDGTANYLF